MVRRLTEARKAAIYAKLHTPTLSNAEIAAEEGITKRYVQILRQKEALHGKPWPDSRTPQNATKLVPAAEEALVHLLKREPGLSMKEQQEFLLREFKIDVSPETIRRHLSQAGFKKQRPNGVQRAKRRVSDRLRQSGSGTSLDQSGQPGVPASATNRPEPRVAPISGHPQAATAQRPGRTGPALPVSIHTGRYVNGTHYLASNNPELVSLDFITSAYNDKTGGVYWSTPLDPETTQLMVQNSSIMAIYRILPSHSTTPLPALQPDHVQQIGMARFITDHVTHAYLTDVYVQPEMRGGGLGTWLVECCDEFLSGIPTLRKLMLATSSPRRNAGFYRRMLGVDAPEQDPERHLIMVRSGPGKASGPV